MTGSVLVVGASGLIGQPVVEEFLDHGWPVIALSRRRPVIDHERSFEHVSVDLRDREAVADLARERLGAVTHVVYAAVHEVPGLVSGWTDSAQMQTNLAMLANLLDPLAETGRLRHVSIFQGTKAYGMHLHPIPIPARERYPRDPHKSFYWLQEDYLTEAAERHGYDWTVFRPSLVLGASHGVAMNVLPVVGAFAAIGRETSTPFAFPGHAAYAREAVDARLIAEATRWAATSPAAHREIFNLTNGEAFSWRDSWSQMAKALGVPAADDRPLSMAEFLPRHTDVWDKIVARYGLRPNSLAQLLGESHHYADYSFGYGLAEPPAPAFISTVKIKQAGFGRVFDTSESLSYWLGRLIEGRIIPGT